MRAKLGCALIAIILLGAGQATDEKKEAAKLQGTWNLDAITYDGEELKIKFKIVFKGNEGVVEGNDRVQTEYAKIKFKLDPASTPRGMDITITGGSQTDATMKGIYELKDGELRICAKVFGTDRPSEFKSADGSSIVLLTLKKAP
jgi:uncharacterized protein (TIGR03067 family)